MDSQIFQLAIYSDSWQDFWHLLKNHLETAKPKNLKIIFTPNPEILVQIEQNPALRKVLKGADILLPDGVGLIMANRWIRCRQSLLFPFRQAAKPKKIQEKITGVDVADKLLVEAAKKNYVTLIIGGRNYADFWGKSGGEYQGEIFEDEQSLIQLKKNLYWTEAYQDKNEPLPVEDQALEKILKKLKPQIVFVAFGSLEQEQWLLEWRARLEQAGVLVAIGVGGSFDLLFGQVPRAPRLIRALSLEWLWRLVQQPWRWRRQLRLFRFLALVRQEAKRWQKMAKAQLSRA